MGFQGCVCVTASVIYVSRRTKIAFISVHFYCVCTNVQIASLQVGC